MWCECFVCTYQSRSFATNKRLSCPAEILIGPLCFAPNGLECHPRGVNARFRITNRRVRTCTSAASWTSKINYDIFRSGQPNEIFRSVSVSCHSSGKDFCWSNVIHTLIVHLKIDEIALDTRRKLIRNKSSEPRDFFNPPNPSEVETQFAILCKTLR